MVLIDGSCVPADAVDVSSSIAQDLSLQGKAILAQDLIEEALPENLSSSMKSLLLQSMMEMSGEAMVDYAASMADWDTHKSRSQPAEVNCPMLVLQSA